MFCYNFRLNEINIFFFQQQQQMLEKMKKDPKLRMKAMATEGIIHSKYAQYILDNYMTLSVKTLFWLACENSGLNMLIAKAQAARNKKIK